MEEKYWKQFENSGRIEDYLNFVSNYRQEEEGLSGPMREDSHAGIYIGDRNHIEANPGRGIRQTYQPFD
ncbi:MAG: hypothetical protein HFH85_13350 [Lachnospiraceae bacterium]|mgnify:CR=1 FL=1|jgi:hypothetical protein|nr:hypothetical protein [Lachnospiraceae bacterium]